MVDGESRGERISRRAVLASLPVTALAGGFAAGGIGAALADGRIPAVLAGSVRDVEPAAPVTGAVPYFDATGYGVVGDGTFDNAEALNTLLAGTPAGHDIVLPAGDYLIRSRLRLRSGVNLVGAGASSTTLRLADGSDTTFVLAGGESGIRIAGITFDGGSQTLQEVALQLDACSDVVIENCHFIRMSHAVHIYATGFEKSSQITVRNNRFSETADYGVRVGQEADGILIEGNIVEEVKKVNAPGPAAFYVRGTNISVIGNTVLGSDDTGVMVAGSVANNIRVMNNVLTTQLVCIYFGTGASGGIITGNTLVSRRDFGVHLFDREGSSSDSIVAQNQIVSTGKSAIQVEGVTDIIIAANMIHEPGSRDGMTAAWRCGVAFITTAGGAASRFVVEGNVIVSEQGASRMAHGILVATPATGVRIAGNIIRGALDEPVKLGATLAEPYYVETDRQIVTSLTIGPQ